MHAQDRLIRAVFTLAIGLGAACSSESTKSPVPTAMTAVAGDQAPSVVAGTAVPSAPAVKLVDANGAGMAGVVVVFSVTAGGGTVEGGTARTDVNGVAAVTKWTLGPVAGANTLSAKSGDLPAVTFTATGLPGAASVLAKTSTDPQFGVVGAQVTAPPSVTVKDANGNPVSGVTVSFSVTGGNGSVTDATQQSSASGVATLGSWKLGTTAGKNFVTASVSDVPPVIFSATGAAGPPVSLAVTPTSVELAPGTTQQIAASAIDQYGNASDATPPTFLVANTAIATVSSSGVVTGVALGNTSVKVTSGALTKTVLVSVTTRVDVPEGGRPFAVRVSANDVLLVGEQDNDRLGRYNLPSRTSAGVIPVGDDPTDVNFSADGLTAYVTNQFSGTLGVINVATNTQVSTVNVGASPFRVAPSRDGSKVYVTTGQGNFVTVNATTLTAGAPLTLGGALNGLAVHPTLPVIYVTSTSGALFEVSETTGQLLRSVSTGGTAQEVVVSPDGTKLYIAMESGPLQIRSTSDLALVTSIAAASGTFGAAVTPDGSTLYATQPNGGNVFVIDVATKAVIRTINGGVPRRVTFDRTASTVVIGNEAGYVSFVK
jgi:YVTN family beta-propeller protein